MQDKKVFAALDQKFDTAPTNLPIIKPEESLVEDDFEQARTALKQMISKGQTAVDDIMSIARQSDHPRAFEVTGQLIKTVAETAKDLLALQKQKKDHHSWSRSAQADWHTEQHSIFRQYQRLA